MKLLLTLALLVAQMVCFADTRGPTVNAHMSVAANGDGVQAPNYRYDRPLPKPAPWTAKWIVPAAGAGETLLFRKTVVLSQAPRQAVAWVTAGANYRLYINGRLADRGPADSGRDFDGGTSERRFYNRRDVGHLLHPGSNVIAAAVLGNAPFLLELETQPGTITATDTSWRGLRSDYLTHGGFAFDGSKEPAGWTNDGYDDAAWPACVTGVGPRELLTLSELPPCMEANYPVMAIDRITGGVAVPPHPFEKGHSITLTADGSFAVRFNRLLPAYIGIVVKGGAGAQLELQPHEVNTPGASNQSSTLTLRDGVQYFESPGFGSLNTINVLVSHVTTPVEIMEVTADFTSQPLSYRGSFACSDDKLTQIWKSCRWATQICLQTWHLDSPQHQEPISDYGDYLIADRVAFDAFGDSPWLARQDLRKWAWVMKNRDYRTFHTSYTLLWLQALLQYYDYTGEMETVRELTPYVYALLERFSGYVGKNGLISEAPNYMFMDWVNIDGFEAHHPPAVIGQGYMTAFYYRALEDAARVAILNGDHDRAAAYQTKRDAVAAAYNRELWDPAAGLYRDGKPFQSSVQPYQWMPADRDITSHSAQNNVLAVLYDIAPPARKQSVIDRTMAQTPWNVRPYYMHFVLSAIAHAGLFNTYGTQRLRQWHIVPETQTFYEMGDSGDLSHGWIATPVCQLSEQILGITPASPGFTKVSVAPQVCDLQWAAGAVPTPHGLVQVAWRRSGDDLTLSVNIPTGVAAAVTMPGQSSTATMVLDGKPLRAGQRRVAVRAGHHQLVGRRLGLPIMSPPAPSDAGSNQVSPQGGAFEKHLSPHSLVALGEATCTGALETGVAHAGGGANADAVRNGTTLNGHGGTETEDDGKTFRGYGTGSSLTFVLNTALHARGYDITKILTFAGHPDVRSSQNYSVSMSLVAQPDKFVTLIPSASVAGEGGSSKIVLTNPNGGVLAGPNGARASHVAAIRFDFADGSQERGTGTGFNVYREFQVLGTPSGS